MSSDTVIAPATLPVELEELPVAEGRASLYRLRPTEGPVVTVMQTTDRFRTKFREEALAIGATHWQVRDARPERGPLRRMFSSNERVVQDAKGQTVATIDDGFTSVAFAGSSYRLAAPKLFTDLGLLDAGSTPLCIFCWGESGPQQRDLIEVRQPMPAGLLALGLFLRIKQP
jgi:hypothetical protein